MSATITLKNTMARRTDAALHLVQHSLMIAGFLLEILTVGKRHSNRPEELWSSMTPAV